MLPTATIDSPAALLAHLKAPGTPGPSLHPRAQDESTLTRWNGWNITQTAGIDAQGNVFSADLHHYASGWDSLSAGLAGRMAHGALKADTDRQAAEFLDRTGITFPATVTPAQIVVLHPDDTPAEDLERAQASAAMLIQDALAVELATRPADTNAADREQALGAVLEVLLGEGPAEVEDLSDEDLAAWTADAFLAALAERGLSVVRKPW